MIYWLFGQPGAGKTTLAKLLIEDPEMKKLGPWVHVDGDNIREVFQNKDYSKAGRLKNGDLAIQLVQYLVGQGLNVVVSIVTPYQYTRNKVKETFPDVNMIELYYDHKEGRRDEGRMVSDYEVVPGDDRVLGLNTSRMTEVDCITCIKEFAKKAS